MTSLLGSWWAPPDAQMDALRNANEALLKEREIISDELLCIKGEFKVLEEERSHLLSDNENLRMQNEQLHAQNEQFRRQNEQLYEQCEQLYVQEQQSRVQNDTLQDENNKLQHEVVQLKKAMHEMRSKDDKIRELQDQIAEYKRSISASTMSVRQLSDTSIQGAMNGLFYAVQDWAFNVVRQEKTVLDMVANEKVEWLQWQVPGGKEGSSTRKIHALIALFSDAVCLSMEQCWVFGVAAESQECPLRAANFVHASLENISGVAPEKKKEWVLLTKELLSKDERLVDRSLRDYVDIIANDVAWLLGNTPVATSAAKKLASAIGPHVHVLQALWHQEADYVLHLLPAGERDTSYKFIPKYHEEINGEEEGVLASSFFPMLLKKTVGDPVQKTVICKAKVTVAT